jgi:signal transduction histidine kinase
LLNESGELIGYRGVNKDITKRKRAEEKLKEAHEMLMVVNNDLERKVEERTADIKRLLKQKDEFIGQLGHDLKNPLGPLINLIPILEKKETDPESKKILEILNRNTNHMKNLVVNTVVLGRLNSPNVKFNIEDTNLLDEINNVIERNSLLFEENNIEIENKAEKNIILKTDKLRLTELFDNLIGNSVKYSPDGGTIKIDAKQDKDFVTVSIKDIGMGMTEEQLSHIFDEFYKADESRHDFDSSGLGLPICKRIVEKHGGKIWAESLGEGKGTTMFFTLPVSSKKADDGKTD